MDPRGFLGFLFNEWGLSGWCCIGQRWLLVKFEGLGVIGKRKIVVAHMGRVPGVQRTPLHQVKSLLGVGFPLSPVL